MSRHLLPGIAAALFVTALAPARAPAAESESSAIKGGVEWDENPGVVALLDRGEVSCTGTLVAPRLVLTAAHCVAFAQPTEVFFGAAPGEGGERTPVEGVDFDSRFHEDWREYDLGLVRLAREAPAPAAPSELLAPGAPDALLGQSVRVVGFGESEDPGDEARKRAGTARVASVEERHLLLEPAPAQPCFGDSGGPVFLADGTGELLVGVVSRGDAGCSTYAAAMRLDRSGDFLEVIEETKRTEPYRGGCAASAGGGRSRAASAALLFAIFAALGPLGGGRRAHQRSPQRTSSR